VHVILAAQRNHAGSSARHIILQIVVLSHALLFSFSMLESA
jgi:hypothetical protein